MARSGNQKPKILYLLRMLSSHTDENNLLSMKEIVETLEEKGIRAERKSIYDDMEVLRDFGIPVKYSRKRPGGYYICGEGSILLENGLGAETVKNNEDYLQPEVVRDEFWIDAGEEREVKIACPPRLYGRVSAYLHGPIDKKIKKDGLLSVTGYAVPGQGFYGWLTSLGPEIQLLKPQKEAVAYRDYLKKIVKKYKEKKI